MQPHYFVKTAEKYQEVCTSSSLSSSPQLTTSTPPKSNESRGANKIDLEKLLNIKKNYGLNNIVYTGKIKKNIFYLIRNAPNVDNRRLIVAS